MKREIAIAVMKDVLKRLRTLRLTQSWYVNAENLPQKFWRSLRKQPDKQIQQFIPQMLEHCDVCAAGSLFMSDIILRNELKCGEFIQACTYEDPYPFIPAFIPAFIPVINVATIYERIAGIFGKKNLSLIESAYMGGAYGIYEDLLDPNGDDLSGLGYPKVLKDAVKFGRKYDDAKKRLRAILLNAIKNNGVFMPAPKKVAV